MNNDIPSVEQLLRAKKKLEELQIPTDSEAWVHAMVAQNKAWCCKKMVESLMYSTPGNRGGRVSQKKGNTPATDIQRKTLPVRSMLISEGLEHLRDGFQALGFQWPDLKRVIDIELTPEVLPERDERQYASLLSTLAHFYSHCGELNMAKGLRVQYRKLYTQSHQIRDRLALI